MLLLLAGCWPWEDAVVPERLSGVWETSEPRYAGCWFEIRDKRIIFNNGPMYKNANEITSIKGVSRNGVGRYDIKYEDLDGEESTLSLIVYSTNKGDVIRFKHQYNIIWRRKPRAES